MIKDCLNGITSLTGPHIYKGNTPVVDLLKPGKQNKISDTLVIKTDVKASDFEGLMKGKTLADLRTALAKNGTYLNILTLGHPDGRDQGKDKGERRQSNAARIF